MKKRNFVSFAHIVIIIVLIAQMAACATPNNESDVSSDSNSYTNETTSYAIDESNDETKSNNDSDETSNISQTIEKTQIPSDEYSITMFRTEALRADGIYPYCNIVQSVEAMNEYYHSISEVYSTESAETPENSFYAYIKKHTSEWFEKNAVIIVVTQVYPPSLPEVVSIIISGERMTINMAESDYVGDTSVYHVFIELSSDYIEGIEYEGVVLLKK